MLPSSTSTETGTGAERPAAGPSELLAPRVLDLAGGTGSISRRVLQRFPKATTVVLDIDAALLAIARGTFAGDARVSVAAVDLGSENWPSTLTSVLGPAIGEGGFDAVLTATALHWLPEDRVRGVYAEARTLLRPGGVLINADYMLDPGLPSLTDGLAQVERRTRFGRWEDGVPSWEAWWEQLRADPELAGPAAERDAFFAQRRGDDHTESLMDSAWHQEALRQAGFAETGLIWRGLLDAAVTGRTAL